VPRGGNLSDAAGVTSHPIDERSKCPCSPPLDRCLGRLSRVQRGSTFPNSDQRLPGQLLRQDTPSTRASPRLFGCSVRLCIPRSLP
jgi:hypothetical protein